MSNQKQDKTTQADIARRALEEKQSADTEQGHEHLETETSHEGQVQGTQRGAPTNGMLNAEGNRPVLERSRKVR